MQPWPALTYNLAEGPWLSCNLVQVQVHTSELSGIAAAWVVRSTTIHCEADLTAALLQIIPGSK